MRARGSSSLNRRTSSASVAKGTSSPRIVRVVAVEIKFFHSPALAAEDSPPRSQNQILPLRRRPPSTRSWFSFSDGLVAVRRVLVVVVVVVTRGGRRRRRPLLLGGAAFFCGWSLDRGTSSSLESLSESPAVGGGGGGFVGARAMRRVAVAVARLSLKNSAPASARAARRRRCRSSTSFVACARRRRALWGLVWSGAWLGPNECVSVGALIDVVEELSPCYSRLPAVLGPMAVFCARSERKNGQG